MQSGNPILSASFCRQIFPQGVGRDAEQSEPGRGFDWARKWSGLRSDGGVAERNWSDWRQFQSSAVKHRKADNLCASRRAAPHSPPPSSCRRLLSSARGLAAQIRQEAKCQPNCLSDPRSILQLEYSTLAEPPPAPRRAAPRSHVNECWPTH